MERLLFNYSLNIALGKLDEDKNMWFIYSFVDNITKTPQDIRNTIYKEALRNIMLPLVVEKGRQHDLIHEAITRIVIMLAERGIILRKKDFNDIDKNYKNEKFRYIPDHVKGILKDYWGEKKNDIPDSLKVYFNNENDALSFIDEAQKLITADNNRIKSNIWSSFINHGAQYNDNDLTALANALKESTKVEFTKSDIQGYIKRRTKKA